MAATAPFAGYAAVLQTSPDGVTYTTVGGVTSAGITPKTDLGDGTALGGGGGVNKVALLKDATVDIAGDYISGDTGQANFLFAEGTACYCKVWYPDASWVLVEGIVESYDFEVKTNGKVSFTAKVVANGVLPTTGTGTLPTDAPAPAPTAGFSGTVKIGGTSTPVSGGATALVSGKTYQLSTSSQRVIDPTVAITVKDGGVAVAASNIASFDYVFGQVTFVAGYTVSGAITMDYSYLPLVAVAKSDAFKLSVKAKLADTTNFDSNGTHARTKLTHEASGTFDSFTIPTTTVGAGALVSSVLNGTALLVEFYMGVGKSFRCWTFLASTDSKFKPDGAVASTYTWQSSTQGAAASEASYAWGTA